MYKEIRISYGQVLTMWFKPESIILLENCGNGTGVLTSKSNNKKTLFLSLTKQYSDDSCSSALKY